MTEKPFFKRTNSFRLNEEDVNKFNDMYDALHPTHKPELRELFTTMFTTFYNKVNNGANEDVNNTENEDWKANYELVNAQFKELQQAFEKAITENNQLKSELVTFRANVPIEFVERYKKFEDVTSEAMRFLFQDPLTRNLNFAEQLELMLDYCERDPSNEFPFQPVAEKIYQKIKSENDAAEQPGTTGAGENDSTGNDNTGAAGADKVGSEGGY
jgi:chromosome segregation ATPase